MKRAFTIVELLVGLALMVALMAASGVIFSMAVKTQRTAAATAEIAQKLVVLTNRLTADLHGLQKDAPVAIWFELDAATGRRYDQIMFFADGDFQTIRQYNNGSGDITVAGNTARIYYGHSWLVSQTNQPVKAYKNLPALSLDASNILARRQHILTQDMNLPPASWPPLYVPFPNMAAFTTNGFTPYGNNYFEYDQITLTDWMNLSQTVANCNTILQTCFDNNTGRPRIAMRSIDTMHAIFAQGIGSFSIQWSYSYSGQIYWFPAGNNPVTSLSDFDDTVLDSDNGGVGDDGVGIYFNMPVGVDVDTTGAGGDDWYLPSELQNRYLLLGRACPWAVTFPEALKFTFTLYDSKGIFPEGKTFTHIVYLNN